MKVSDPFKLFSAALTGKCMYQEGDRVLAAVSGGADSVCMLLMLKKYLPEGTLGAAHFNHGLRGDESDRDESFVKDLCAKLEVPFFSEKADISAAAAAEKSGIEECARKYRYEFDTDKLKQGHIYLISSKSSKVLAHLDEVTADRIQITIIRSTVIAVETSKVAVNIQTITAKSASYYKGLTFEEVCDPDSLDGALK